jgi:hypothetical protein
MAAQGPRTKILKVKWWKRNINILLYIYTTTSRCEVAIDMYGPTKVFKCPLRQTTLSSIFQSLDKFVLLSSLFIFLLTNE